MSVAPIKSGDLFADVPARIDEEERAILAELPDARIERIVSTGQASPEGFWYDQDWTEWFAVLSGSAGVRIAGEEKPRILPPGAWLEIPPPRPPSRRLDRRRRADRLARDPWESLALIALATDWRAGLKAKAEKPPRLSCRFRFAASPLTDRSRPPAFPCRL